MVVVKGCPQRPQQVASALIEIAEIYCNSAVVSYLLSHEQTLNK